MGQAALIAPAEKREVVWALDSAALTYVAATLMSALTLLYFVFRAGGRPRSNPDRTRRPPAVTDAGTRPPAGFGTRLGTLMCVNRANRGRKPLEIV